MILFNFVKEGAGFIINEAGSGPVTFDQLLSAKEM